MESYSFKFGRKGSYKVEFRPVMHTKESEPFAWHTQVDDLKFVIRLEKIEDKPKYSVGVAYPGSNEYVMLQKKVSTFERAVGETHKELGRFVTGLVVE